MTNNRWAGFAIPARTACELAGNWTLRKTRAWRNRARRARVDIWGRDYGFAKLGDGLFRKMGDGVGAAKQDVESGRIAHGRLQLGEEVGGFRGFLGSEEGDAKKVGGLEIVLQGDGFLQFGDGSVEIAGKEVQAAESVVSASVAGIGSQHGL